MVLFNTPKTPAKGCEVYMFWGQHFIQVVFVLVALGCIPVMLLGKPIKIMQARKLANVSKLHYDSIHMTAESASRITQHHIT